MMHILKAQQFDRETLKKIFKLADKIREDPFPILRQSALVMATLFYEPSTRTSSSFYAAMTRLGGSVIQINEVNYSSVTKGETLEEGATRELLEETNIKGKVKQILGTCSHFNTIFGDILLIGIEMLIFDWSQIKAGDDATEATLFPLEDLPNLAFPCYENIVEMSCHRESS